MGSCALRAIAASVLVSGIVFAGCRHVNAEERGDAGVRRAPVDGGATESDASSAAPSDGGAASSEAGAERRALTDHRTVLHVGDSTVGYTLGVALELGKMFRAGGVAYESRTVTSAGLHTFAQSKVVEKLVGEKNPDLVIIQLGTNNLTVPNPAAFIPDVKAIVAQAGGKPCYWIGPIPLDQPEHGMRAMLRENVAPCTFFDSFDLKLARQDDHIHPTQPAAKKWADAFWKFAEAHPVD